ncbi:alpha/beta-hydrolase [Meredithblackwellia eburnea MCA 4105]
MSTIRFDAMFKTVQEVPLEATIFAPPAHRIAGGRPTNPAMIFFHSGGITGGSRLGHLPPWLVEACIKEGWVFATVDYRLISSAPIDEIHQDFLDAFNFMGSEKLDSLLNERGAPGVDARRIIVAGASAGAYAGAILTNHLVKWGRCPVAYLNLYGQLDIGKYFYNSGLPQSHSLGPATRQTMEQLAYLFREGRKPVIAGDVKWYLRGREGLTDPKETEDYDQTTLTLNLFYNGVTADVFANTQGLSSQLGAPSQKYGDIESQRQIIPQHLQHYFPLVSLSSSFPPSVLVHGIADAVISYDDSVTFAKALKDKERKVELVLVEGEKAGHGFDRFETDMWWRKYLQPAFEKLKGFVREAETKARL